MADQMYDTANLDVVQHPVLGELKFPKDMPFDERNSHIDSMMKDHAAQQEQQAQAGFIAKTGTTAPEPPKAKPQEEGIGQRFQERLGEFVPQAALRPLSVASKYDPFEALGRVGTEAGEKAGKGIVTAAIHPIDTAKQFKFGQALQPSGAEGPLLQQVAQEHPIATGTAEAIGGVVGGLVFDPRNYPFLAEQGGAVAGKNLLKRAIDSGFALNMGRGAYEGAQNLLNNWDKMTPEQRTKAAVEAGIQTVFAATAVRGATKRLPQYGGPVDVMKPGELPTLPPVERTPAPTEERTREPYREATPLGMALMQPGELPTLPPVERTPAPTEERTREAYREPTPYARPITPEEAAKSAEQVGAKPAVPKSPLGEVNVENVAKEVTKQVMPEISKAVERAVPGLPKAAPEESRLGEVKAPEQIAPPPEAPKVEERAPEVPKIEEKAPEAPKVEEAAVAPKEEAPVAREPGLVGAEYKETAAPSAAEVTPDLREQVGTLSHENLKKLAAAHGLNPDEYGDFKKDRVYNPEKRRYEISPGRTRLADDIVNFMPEDEKAHIGDNIRQAKNEPGWAERELSGKAKAERAAGFFPRLRGEAEVKGEVAPEVKEEAPKPAEVPVVPETKAETPVSVETLKTGDQYKDAVQLVANTGKAAASVLQKGLGIGYGDAVQLIDRMEKEGIIAPAEGAGPRKIANLPEWAQKAKAAGYGESNTGVTKAEYEQAKKDFNNKLTGGLKTGIPLPVEELSKMAQYHIEAGARSFADWSDRMVKDLGETVRPYLANVWHDNFNHVVPSPKEPVAIPEGVEGSTTSKPHGIYHDAAYGDGNPWVRRSSTPEGTGNKSNTDRQLLVQISSNLINRKALESASKDVSEQYYDKLYSGKREGYSRMADFWEIPQWIGFASHMMPNADVYVVRDVAEAQKFLNEAKYGHVAFSALDVNKDIIKDVIKDYKGKVAVGGYVDRNTFFENPNVKWHDNLGSLAEELGLEKKDGVDYRHFQGSDVIPRLTMSDGCLHKCAFCVIPKEIKMQSSDSIRQQADAIAKLGTKLVYVSDKTFGQAKNYDMLTELHENIKKQNPDFKGFIVQTTAAQLGKMSPEFLNKSGIKFVELGIESYNDPILKEMHKPATEKIIDESIEKLRKAGIALIPNILIGYPGETAETYAHTLDFLKKNQDIISHANVYNLALYKDTELGKKMTTATDGDFNENVLEKSWYNGSDIHQTFAGKLYDFASKMLDKTPEALKPEEVVNHVKAGVGGDEGKKFAVITAENPHNEKASEEDNSFRNLQLKKELRERGYNPVDAQGIYRGTKENSLFVPHIDPNEAVSLGMQHGQQAIITHKGLHDIDNNAFTPATGVHVGDEAKKQDAYTQVGDQTFSLKLGEPEKGKPVRDLKPTDPLDNATIEQKGNKTWIYHPDGTKAPDGNSISRMTYEDMGKGVAKVRGIYGEKPGQGQQLYDTAIKDAASKGFTRFESDDLMTESSRRAWARLSEKYDVHMTYDRPDEPTYWIDLKDQKPEIKTKSQATAETARMSDAELKKQGYTQEQIDAGLHLPRQGGGAETKPEGVIPEEMGKHLHPEERAGLKTEVSQTNFVNKVKALPEVKEFVDIASQAAGERKWYQRGTAAVEALAKELPDYFKEGDTKKFLDLVAALSPRQAITENMTEALRVWKEYVDQGRPTEEKQLKKLLRDNIGMNKGSKISNALKAFGGSELWPDLKKNRYFKVPSFSKNLNGFLDKVTSDGWIGAFADMNERDIQHPSGYHALSAVTRAAADELGWEPAEAQAAIWAFVKTLAEKGETEPEEIRALSKDFADIIGEDEDIQDILKDMGVDHAKLRDRLAKEVPAKPEVQRGSTPTTQDSIRRLTERLQRQGREIPKSKAQRALEEEESKGGFLFGGEEGDTSFNPAELEPFGKKPSKLGKVR